jgi:shikimate dehydrogenase
MHNAAFAEAGINVVYEAWDVPPDALGQAVTRLRDADVLGANVTIPHKQAVMQYMDDLTEAASSIGAVNTIVNKGGNLLGHNTDAGGYLRALEQANLKLAGQNVLVLGAGGAARAIVFALLKAGAVLTLYNRTSQKAIDLASAFADVGATKVIATVDDLHAVAKQASLIVNTTSVGMVHGGIDPNESPLATQALPEAGFVSDIVYRPAQTRLLREAAAKGLGTQNGLPMLVYQGAESFQLWTLEPPDTHVMFNAANGVLEAE